MKGLYKTDWSVIHRSAIRDLAAHPGLPKETLRVLLYILGDFEQENRIWPGNQRIVDELMLHPSAVSRSLGLLLKQGILTRHGKRGYRLHPHYGFRGDPTGIAKRLDDGRVIFVEDARS